MIELATTQAGVEGLVELVLGDQAERCLEVDLEIAGKWENHRREMEYPSSSETIITSAQLSLYQRQAKEIVEQRTSGIWLWKKKGERKVRLPGLKIASLTVNSSRDDLSSIRSIYLLELREGETPVYRQYDGLTIHSPDGSEYRKWCNYKEVQISTAEMGLEGFLNLLMSLHVREEACKLVPKF